MLRQFTALVLLMMLTVLAAPAFSQDAGPDAKQADVVVLKFMTYEADDALMEYFYRTLTEAINAHPDMRVVSSSDVSVNEMVLVLGCEAASAECLAQLSDFVEGDRIAFGAVQQSGGIYLLSLSLFDFASGKFVRQIEDATVQGSPEELKSGIAGIIDNFLYGNIGKLEVRASGAPGAVAFLGEQELGATPLEVEELPLGEHVLTVQTPDGRTQTQVVRLHPHKVSRVQLNFAAEDAGVAARGPANRAYTIPGWSAIGLGTAGLIAGVVGTINLSNHNAEAEEMICQGALCTHHSASRAHRLQNSMDNAYTMSVVGYSVAALGIAAGSYLLYQGYSGAREAPAAPSTAPEESTAISFDFAPRPGGASVGFSLDF